MFSKLFILSLILFTLACDRLNDTIVSGKEFRAGTQNLELVTQQEVPLQIDKDIVEVSQLQSLDDQSFALLDKFVTHQAYIFDWSGKLHCELGQPGQGPGEYRAPTGVAQIDGQWFLSDLGGKLNIYQRDACQFLDFHFFKESPAISRGLYPLGPDEILMPIFSRYAKHSIYIFDKQAKELRAFSKPDRTFGRVFDTFFPQGGVVIAEDLIYQFFNHRYEILVFDFQGKRQRKIRLASGLYQPPEFSKSKHIEGAKMERDYRSTFTQFVGLYSLNSGWVTVLREWKDNRTYMDTLEFWNSDFEGIGRTKVPEGERVVATKGNQVVFFVVGEKASFLLFKTVNPRPTTSSL